MKTSGTHLWQSVATHVVGTIEAGGLAGIATYATAAWIGVALPAFHVENAFGAERDTTAGIALEAALLGIRSTAPAGASPEARTQLSRLLDPAATRVVDLTHKPIPTGPAVAGPVVVQVDQAVVDPPASAPAPEPTRPPAPAPAPPAAPVAPPAAPSEPPAPQKPSSGDTSVPSTTVGSVPPGHATTPGTVDTSPGPSGGGTTTVPSSPGKGNANGAGDSNAGGNGNGNGDAGASNPNAGGANAGGNGNGNGNAGGDNPNAGGANAGGNGNGGDNPNAGGANAGGNGNGKGH